MMGILFLAPLMPGLPETQDSASLEKQLFERMQYGQWSRARAILEERKKLGAQTFWLSMTEGDLDFWEGFPERAIERYRFAQADISLVDTLRSKIAAAQGEIAYRERLGRRSSLSLILGTCTILALLGLPLLVLKLWRRRGP